MIFVEIRNGKFWTNDLLVYYGAAEDFFNGNTPYAHPYGLGSGFFKYPPPTLYFFSCFPLLNFFEIQILHAVSSVFCFLGVVFILHNRIFANHTNISSKQQERKWVFWLAFIFVAIHLVREFHLGNINIQLLFLFCAGYSFFQKEKKVFAALCWAVLFLFKPFFVILIIPLIFNQFKFVVHIALLGLLFIILPMLFENVSTYFSLWKQWFESILQHNNYQVNHESISSLVFYYFSYQSTWGPTFVLLLCLIALILSDQLRLRRLTDLEWVIVLLASTPTLFKTDTQHFMFTLPLFFLLLREVLFLKNVIYWISFGLLIVGYSFNSNDLLGTKLGSWVTECGLLGISNLGLILLFVFLRKAYPKRLK